MILNDYSPGAIINDFKLFFCNALMFLSQMNTGYPTSALRDGLHPNAQGDAIIASRLSPVLINQVQSAIGGTPATTTAVRTTTTTGAVRTSTQGSNPTTTSRASNGSGAPAWGQCGK